MSHDVIVVGLGGMGGAAAAELAARGLRVLGLDRFQPPHELGSSHGRSRIIRQAYMEDPAYVPLLRRAYERWHELEAETGRVLLRRTGGLMLGAAGSTAVTGSRASAVAHGLEHDLLDADQIRRRFPPFRIADDTIGLYEHVAGALDPELCVRTFWERAGAAGADLRAGERVTGWLPEGDGVLVRTATGEHRAGTLVLAPGPWAGALLGVPGRHLEPTREVMHWFRPAAGLGSFRAPGFPVFIWETAPEAVFYGFPALEGDDGGVKVAIHHGGRRVDPDAMARDVQAADVEAMRAFLRPHLPGLDGAHLHGAVCLYTNSPDQHFLLGLHPECARVALVAGLSGHGFKFASVVGEILADLVTGGGTALPIERFDPGRFDRAP